MNGGFGLLSGFGLKLLLGKTFYGLLIVAIGFAFGTYRANKKFVQRTERLICDLALAKQQLVAFEQVQLAQIGHVVEKVLSQQYLDKSEKSTVEIKNVSQAALPGSVDPRGSVKLLRYKKEVKKLLERG